MHVNVADAARFQPTGIGEGDPLEAKVVDGLVHRAAEFDEFLHGWSRHCDLGQILARQRLVVDLPGGPVQIPLAWLVEQFQRVFGIRRQAVVNRIHPSLGSGQAELRLEHGDDGLRVLTFDPLDFAAGVVPFVAGSVNELDVPGIAPPGDSSLAGRIAPSSVIV